MPDNKGPIGEDMSLSALSDADLLSILQSTLDLNDDEIDVNLIKRVNAELDRREGEPDDYDVEASLKDFKDNYLPTGPIYLGINTGQKPQQTRLGNRRGRHRIGRMPIVAALFAGILLATTVTAYSFGIDIIGAIAHWTEDTFGFSWRGERSQMTPVTDLEYNDFQAFLVENEIDPSIVPKWIPDDFELIKLSIVPAPVGSIYHALYEATGRSLTIQVSSEVQMGTILDYEKDENLVSLYMKNDIEHYILTNNGQIKAIWIVENCECTVFGDITIDSIKLMIDSIYD